MLWFSLSYAAVEGLAGGREQVPEFKLTGGRGALRAAGGPRASQDLSALQPVSGARNALKAQEVAAQAVRINGHNRRVYDGPRHVSRYLPAHDSEIATRI